MLIRNHGGYCCGIKTMYGFNDPYSGMSSYTPSDPNTLPDYRNCYAIVAPAETTLERFNRLVVYWRKVQTSGMLEVVLATIPINNNGVYSLQTTTWEPILMEAGFKKGVSWKNSNSSNICTQYTLIQLNRDVV